MVFNGLHCTAGWKLRWRLALRTARRLRAAFRVSTTLLLALLLFGKKAADFTHTLMHSSGCTFQRVEFQSTLLETCTAVLRAAIDDLDDDAACVAALRDKGCRFHRHAHAFIWMHLSTPLS